MCLNCCSRTSLIPQRIRIVLKNRRRRYSGKTIQPIKKLFYNELNFYLDQLNEKIIICGDFNAKHNEWNSEDSNAAGNILHSLIVNLNNLTLYTPKDLGTRMDSYRNTESTIDLCFGSSELFPCMSINKKPVTSMSDHFPL